MTQTARRCVIIGGADIQDYERLRAQLEPGDYCIYCDSGLKHREALGVQPSLIVGDFDSHENPHADVETIVLPTVKDDTDTVLGVVGGRLDHTLGNVFILYYLDQQGKRGRILDDFSEMELVSAQPVSIPDRCSFFSLLNLSGCAKGVTIERAKYCLRDAEIPCEYQYGVSNEVLPGETATVSVREGKLLLIRVF